VASTLSIPDLTAKGAKSAKDEARNQSRELIEQFAKLSLDSLFALFASWR
jgi:hypothetical protein